MKSADYSAVILHTVSMTDIIGLHAFYLRQRSSDGSVNETILKVRQQDAYLAIRPAYPRGCCPRAAKGDKTYLQPVFLHG